ncbi:hypothetical protein EVAR_24993_1 [Eumeta japonica]|uniref:Uncharacterized protein n=1 Tax=Eumeta variegata TaxID=151549 RepID=A0A4C1XHL2_EUMVA|nr:hypothetical protein EVAR_24993_1 [Eumeta japonica]
MPRSRSKGTYRAVTRRRHLHAERRRLRRRRHSVLLSPSQIQVVEECIMRIAVTSTARCGGAVWPASCLTAPLTRTCARTPAKDQNATKTQSKAAHDCSARSAVARTNRWLEIKVSSAARPSRRRVPDGRSPRARGAFLCFCGYSSY